MADESPQSDTLSSIHTTSLPALFSAAGISILVSTYQAGKLIAVRARGEELNTHFRNFAAPMGLALRNGRLAIGTNVRIQEFHNQPQIAARLDPPGTHDACFLPRQSIVTGQIGIHDVAWVGDQIWGVNTRFSCLCTFDPLYSFVPRWRPKFIDALAPEDRCHLNGMCVKDDKPAFVTALGESNDAAGWRPDKAKGGCLIDIASGEFVTRGLSMPHSPRWYDGKLWILESGDGSLATVDLASGKLTTVAQVPGFTRGLDFYGPYAFIGLSQVRESAVFSGIPITVRMMAEERKCGVWVVDTRNGQTIAFLEFKAGVQEIFAIQVLANTRWPDLLTDDQPMVAEAIILPDDALSEVKQ